MGRKATKPTRLRVLDGQRNEKGEKPEDTLAKEPEVQPLKNIESPSDLDEIAKKTWSELVPILSEAKLLTQIDRDNLAILCQIRSWIIQLHKELEEQPFGMPEYTVDPTGQEHMRVRVDARRKELRLLYGIFRSYAAEFGLTPRGRVGLIVGPKEPDSQGKPELNR